MRALNLINNNLTKKGMNIKIFMPFHLLGYK